MTIHNQHQVGNLSNLCFYIYSIGLQPLHATLNIDIFSEPLPVPRPHTIHEAIHAVVRHHPALTPQQSAFAGAARNVSPARGT